MGESIHGKIGELLDYEKLSAIHLFKLPKVEKNDVPNFINCPKYEKAKANLNQKMERYQSKVDRCNNEIHQTKQNIAAMEQELVRWKSQASTFLLDRTDIRAVEKQNHAANMYNNLLEKISNAKDKHNDLIDKRTEAVEEAEEKRRELTAEALLVIDEDIVAVIDRCTEIVGKLAGSQNTEDLVAVIDICMIELRIYAMFEDLIDENAARKDCTARITEVNQKFAVLCANEHVMNYLVDMYRRNQSLVQKNADICQQVTQVLGSVDQSQLTNLTQSVDAVLTEKIKTTFEYKGIVDPAQLDEVIVQINKTIAGLKQSIVKANEAVTDAGDFAKTGVSAYQKAETLLSSMKSNAEAMKKDIFSQNHFAVQIIEKEVIDDFYDKEVRPAATALRKHIVSAIGEGNIDSLVKGDKDFFSLEKAENAIKQANLLRLQNALDMIPTHIKKTTDLIASAESDIQEAGKVPKQNADALNSELRGKYIRACFPMFGWISAMRILRQVKAFEPAFRSTNQIYQELANALLAKNKKMTTVVMIIGAILGLGGIAVSLLLNRSVVLWAIVLVFYVVTIMLLITVRKQLRSFCGDVSS